ncbi:MAG: hypothetical protein M3Q30_02085 [Actinomycetota bacterium]|nr:hypothetical protein [Actinomycetota bacterium]
MNDVSCTSSVNCFAVGFGGGTLVERWNGTSLAIVPSPNPPGALYGVSCTSTTNCFAVGYGDSSDADVPLIERWNGTSWAIVPSPNPNPVGWGRATLYGVSCTNTTSCFAVGEVGHGHGPFFTLVERWNGTSWTLVPSPSPDPGGAPNSALHGVSCTSTTNCFAVGNVHDVFETHPDFGFVERWNGASWAIVPNPSPGPTGETASALYGVSCTSTTSCFAVGASVGGALVSRWNGTSWVIVPSSNPTRARGSQLHGVSCTSTTSCFAVGHSSNSSLTNVMLVERWNGIGWAIVPSPNPSGAQGTTLLGVSCTNTSSCFAVGYRGSDSGSLTLVERRR